MKKTAEERREWMRLYQKRRRAEKREEIIASDRERNSTPERRAWKREWYRKNADKVRAKINAKYWADPEAWLAKSREARRKNPAITRRQTLKKHGGLTLARFEDMRHEQGGACAICREAFVKVPHVDHNHSTGQVRSLLCGSCNQGIGHLKDNPERMEAAAAYIRTHRTCQIMLVKDA